MKGAKQTTLRDHVAVSGIGVHSGLPVTLTLHPADDDAGIVFQRVSADGSIEREIRADVRAVTATEFATVLATPTARSARPPNICSRRCAGSASTTSSSRSTGRKCRSWTAAPRAFVDAIDQAGLTTRALPRRYIEVIKPVRVSQGRRATANCGPTSTASASRPKSNSTIR